MSYIGYVGNNKALVQTEPGFMMYADTLDTGITPHLYRNGRWEPHVTSFLQKRDLKGKTCIDVGANMGYYSLLFGHLGAKEVFGFEPIPRLIQMCKDSGTFIAETDFHFYQRGLSDKRAEDIKFETCKGNIGGSRINDVAGQDTISTMTLDSLNIPSFDFMKIDVEGHEPEVLIGASKTIKRSPNPKIIMEWNSGYVDYGRLIEIWGDLNLKPQLIQRGRMRGTLSPFNPRDLNDVDDILLTKII